MIAAIEDVQKKYEQRDLYTSKAIENTVESLNEELHNIGFWKLFRNRKDIDLQVDVSDLKESIPIDDSKKLLAKPKVEISSSEIKKNHKIYDLRQLWIDTTKDDEFEEPIDVDKENL